METPIVAPARIDLRMLVRFLGRALWKTTLVLAIPLILTVVYVAYLQKAGELLPASRIATMSLLPKRILWLTGYYDTGRLHKLDVALRIQPEVAVIGTSRSMQLRAEFFDKIPPSAFYNVGGCCANAVDAQHAVHALLSSATKPKVIILGVETWWFQSPSPNPSRARAMFGDAGADVSASLTTVVQTLSDFADRVQTLQLAWRDPRFQTIAREHFATTLDTAVGAELLGVFARATKNGFRNDGSFRYG
ncbi:MAG: hypothetical protein ABI442_05575, partial [Gemmatimonadaceae bacterium]